MTIKVTSDFSDVFKALHKIDRAPSSTGVAALNSALDALFLETQARVHVITGSLRASGKTDDRTRGHVWVGEITYGGAAPGFPHNPVRYASYEQARAGSHDFMHDVNLDIGNSAMLFAVEEALGD